MIKKICVYCASSRKSEQVYLDAAYRLGKLCAKNEVSVVYGGGAEGLMGSLARGVLDGEGIITGVIPGFMVDMEWAHPGVKDMRIVDTMHERKKMMMHDADAAVALPGGSGTLEELVETISLKRLGLFPVPVIILSTEGYYEPLLKFFEHCIEHNFMNARHRDIWQTVSQPEDVLPAVADSPDWPGNARQFAVVQ